jgi:hypothetical protein
MWGQFPGRRTANEKENTIGRGRGSDHLRAIVTLRLLDLEWTGTESLRRRVDHLRHSAMAMVITRELRPQVLQIVALPCPRQLAPCPLLHMHLHSHAGTILFSLHRPVLGVAVVAALATMRPAISLVHLVVARDTGEDGAGPILLVVHLLVPVDLVVPRLHLHHLSEVRVTALRLPILELSASATISPTYRRKYPVVRKLLKCTTRVKS